MELRLIHLILIVIFLLVSILGAANKRRMEQQEPMDREPDSPGTPQREGMTLAEWIEELRRQSEARNRPSVETSSAPPPMAPPAEAHEEVPREIESREVEWTEPEPVRARNEEPSIVHRPRDIEISTATTPEFSGRKILVATGVQVERPEKIRHPLRAALTRDGVKQALVLSEVLSRPVSLRTRGRGRLE